MKIAVIFVVLLVSLASMEGKVIPKRNRPDRNVIPKDVTPKKMAVRPVPDGQKRNLGNAKFWVDEIFVLSDQHKFDTFTWQDEFDNGLYWVDVYLYEDQAITVDFLKLEGAYVHVRGYDQIDQLVYDSDYDEDISSIVVSYILLDVYAIDETVDVDCCICLTDFPDSCGGGGGDDGSTGGGDDGSTGGDGGGSTGGDGGGSTGGDTCLAFIEITDACSPTRYGFDLESSKIVGGSEVKPPGYYSFMVSVKAKYGSHFCGGSIISKNHVLTAAHCVDGETAGGVEVRINGHSLNDGQKLSVAEIFSHQGYDSETMVNDIAILKLGEDAECSSVVSLPTTSSSDFTDCEVTAIGWGTLSSGGSMPDKLQYVKVPVVSNAVCNTAYGSGSITADMICAGVMVEGGKDSCQGDSGGPLVYEKAPNEYVQVGVVSWGTGCADGKYPGVYARVSKFQGWIDGIVNS